MKGAQDFSVASLFILAFGTLHHTMSVARMSSTKRVCRCLNLGTLKHCDAKLYNVGSMPFKKLFWSKRRNAVEA